MRTETMQGSYLVFLIAMSIGAVGAYPKNIGKIRTCRRYRCARDPAHPEIVSGDDSS